MQHIALITPGILPVPASLGGAIETLLTTVIEQNEKTPQYVFDVYTVLTATQERREYRNTHIIEIPLTRFQMLIDRILDKIARTFHIPGKRVLDRVIYKQFVNCYRKRLLEESSPNQEKPYDAIIFENMTSTATFFLNRSLSRFQNESIFICTMTLICTEPRKIVVSLRPNRCILLRTANTSRDESGSRQKRRQQV